MVTSIMSLIEQNSGTVCQDPTYNCLRGAYARSEFCGNNMRNIEGLGHEEGYTFNLSHPLSAEKWKIGTVYSGSFEKLRFDDYSVTLNFYGYGGVVGSCLFSKALVCGRSVPVTAVAWYEGYYMTCSSSYTSR